MDIHQFFLGNAFDAHTYFGAHVTEQGVVFRTLAPNAAAVDLIWEGGDWEPIPMQRIHDGGVYELTVPEAVAGQMYKYRITPQNPDGDIIDHCDPYGFGMELRPNNASIIRDLSSYTFHDKKWLAQRGSHRKKPVNIYEVHLGSWRTNPNNPNGWYTYEEIAPKLVDYVKKAGYNYIEFMPLSEHPADCSWGYQNTGFFSPTSRYGTADQLKYFVDCCHQNGIGVIMDFVPVHFALDSYGLAQYDGTALYEYPHSAVGVSEWGSCNFMHSRGEVRSFLQSSANYWIKEFHIDEIADQNGRKDDDGNQVGNHKRYRIIRGKTFLRSFVFRSGMAPLVGLVTGAGAATPLQHVEQRVEHRTARQRTRSPAPLPGEQQRDAGEGQAGSGIPEPEENAVQQHGGRRSSGFEAKIAKTRRRTS